MKTRPTPCPIFQWLSAVSLLTFYPAATALAVDVEGIDVHGSISASGSYSDTYNYLGDTSDNFDVNLVDIVLNGTHRFENGLRAGAQIYAYKVGSYNDMTIDWACLDYSFVPWLGVRVGRNKIPMGLYTDSQDLDAIRTFASLPISFYPRTLRSISSSADGADIYGNVSLHSFGSLDYQFYAGSVDDMKEDAPLLRGINGLMQFDNLQITDGIFGTSIFWNTPLDGLRVGYSYREIPTAQVNGVLGSSSQIHGSDLAMVNMVDGIMGAGTWDNSGMFAGTAVRSESRKQYQIVSAEYTYDKWVFAAEYMWQDTTDSYLYSSAFKSLGIPSASASTYSENYYGMVTYQATDKIGLGVYYSYENTARKTSGSSSDPTVYTKDWAAALSYALTDAWLFKLEGHLMDGRSMINSAGDDNSSNGTDDQWTYFVIKTTFSF